MGLYEKLIEYGETGRCPMHMPGHKRNPRFCSLPDITEIEGFDDLHDAHGILKDAMDEAAAIYGSKKCFYLVNGSTCGILAAVSSMAPGSGKILMARNCHKAVYNAVYINSLTSLYIQPEFIPDFGLCGPVSPELIEEKLSENPEISLVVITSPTYGGVTSDVKKIAGVCHNHGALLLVDEAHGAHFGFSGMFPENAVTSGADAVVMSLHKTLPAMTQTALLHVCSDRVDIERLKYMLSVFETSSPSYILMASIEKCVSLLKNCGRELFAAYEENLRRFYGQLSGLKHLRLFTGKNIDPGKIVVSTGKSNITGPELFNLLREKNFELEMSGLEHVIAITSICDSGDTLDSFAHALLEIDSALSPADKSFLMPPEPPQAIMSIRSALDGGFLALPPEKALGKIAAEFLYIYPPGIPLAAPGEELTRNVLEYSGKSLRAGLHVYASGGRWPEKIRTVK